MSPTHAATTKQLKNRARSLGFHAVGIAPARPLNTAAAALRERIQRGLLAGYGFAAGCEPLFTEPERVMPGAKSIVAVALSYLRPPQAGRECQGPTARSGGPKGKVSRFAWGRDYHVAVRQRLESLRDWLREETGCESSVLVDTGPLLDRAAAYQAGVGAYGKNCLLVTPQYGSWVALGELITEAELEPGEPSETDRCGSCELCMKVCPSGAIVEPYVIDVNRCVSHLTQMSGYAPRELRKLAGSHVYGCDICQEVCPRNRSVFPTDAEEFCAIHPPGRKPSLPLLLRLSPEEFDRDIVPNTMGWIGRTRLRRNALVALGNSGDPSGLPVLVEALQDPQPLIRGHAAWALGQIGMDRVSRKKLEKAHQAESDAKAKAEMAAALEQ